MKIILVIVLVVILSVIGIVVQGTTHKVEQADLNWCDHCGGPCEDDYDSPCDPDGMRDW